jgi:hypothetical protein
MRKRSSAESSTVERLLLQFQNNRVAVVKLASITAVVWSVVVLALSMYAPMVATAVKLSMPPVLIGAIAWGMARSVRARREGLYAMGAVWFCLIVVFISQVQYYSLLSTAKIETPSTQTEQIQ